MKTFSFLCLSLACLSNAADAGPAPDPAAAPCALHAGATVDHADGAATLRPSFPTRRTRPTTPRAVDRLAHRIRAELGGRASAALRLCVGGDGAVTTVDLARSSGLDALDAAFLTEARKWRYQPLAAPHATACQTVEIAYQLR